MNALRRGARILLAGLVAGVALATGTVFGLMLLSAGLIVPGAVVLLAYFLVYSGLLSGLTPHVTRPDPARTVTLPAIDAVGFPRYGDAGHPFDRTRFGA